VALEIVRAETAEDLAEVRAMLCEYVEFIASGWPQVDRDAWAEELRDLRAMYEPILLAHIDGERVACAMLRDGGEPGTCEVRRLYVRPESRRCGVARELMTRLMAEARELGYTTMRLVAVTHFTGAIPLYESLGFRHVEPYRPSTMTLDLVRFMEREL
jgi:GNAT superfamily N-acetyltransferase